MAHITIKKKDTTKNTEDRENIMDIFGIYFPNGGKSEAAWQDKLVFYSAF